MILYIAKRLVAAVIVMLCVVFFTFLIFFQLSPDPAASICGQTCTPDRIEAIRNQPVGSLPYGLQKRVELARALAAEPRLLILDEPMAGMNQEEKEYMARFILDARDAFGTAVLLIEHHMDVVTALTDRLLVLTYGEPIAEGDPHEVIARPAVVAAYLGKGRSRAA